VALTWQMACREEDIPEPGDHVVYDVRWTSPDTSPRTAAGTIRAFHNSCLHRGTKLRLEDGRVGSFRMSVPNGWRWDLDGTLHGEAVRRGISLRSCADRRGTRLPGGHGPATGPGSSSSTRTVAAEPFERNAAQADRPTSPGLPFDRCYKAFHAVKEVPAN
jgi:nitrite reductase/ring-hydroxylating ferredoxin subunit